jgi:hypothetical protein
MEISNPILICTYFSGTTRKKILSPCEGNISKEKTLTILGMLYRLQQEFVI